MEKNRDGIPAGPFVGKIFHPLPGGGSLDVTVGSEGRSLDILHKEKGAAGTIVQINFRSSRIEFVDPAVCGRAIRCLFTTGGSLILDTLTGRPWRGEKLRFLF